MLNAPDELPGLHDVSHNLHIKDSRDFIEHVPDLVARLKLRHPKFTESLDFSSNSLSALDEYLADVVDDILSRDLPIAQTIDRELIHEVVAYVGQVVILNKHGQWQMSNEKDHFGPLVVFPVSQSNKPLNRAFDIGFQVLTALIEGEPLSSWYEEEMDSRA